MSLLSTKILTASLLLSSAAYADSAAPSMTTGGGLMSLLPMVLIFVVFYFFLIRPQVKRQKTTEAMINSLKVGDQVIAAGGLFGTIRKLDGDSIYIEIADNVRIKALKSSVSELASKNAPTEVKLEAKEATKTEAPVKKITEEKNSKTTKKPVTKAKK